MREDSYWVRLGRQATTRRRALGGAAGAGLSLVLAACGGGTSKGSGATSGKPSAGQTGNTAAQTQGGAVKRGGTLNVLAGTSDGATGWDPHKSFSFKTHTVLSYSHERVMEFPFGAEADPGDYTAVPGLAEKIEQPDQTTFTAKLHQGVKFHNKAPVNGRELEANDVKYTIDRMIAKKFTYRNIFEDIIDTMQIPDKYTITFKLKFPYADFPVNLANHYAWIIAHESVEAAPNGDISRADQAIGTGAFMVDSFEPGQKATYVKNPDYWRKDASGGALPYLDKVVTFFSSDTATQEAMIRSKQVDLGSVNLPSVAAMKQSNPELQWWQALSAGGDVFYFRLDKNETQDIRVRQAIAYGFDRKGWLKSQYVDTGVIHNGPPLPASYAGWFVELKDLGEGAEFYNYKPEEAKKLLAAAGHPDGFSRTMDLANAQAYGQPTFDRGQLAADLMKQIGINLKLNPKEYGDWLATGHAGIYDEFAFGPLTPLVAIDDWLWGLHHSKSITNKAHANFPDVDALLDKQRGLYDVEERKKVVADAQKLVAKYLYYVFPPAPYTTYAQQPYVKNFRPKSGYNIGAVVRATWIDKG
jgi:peptide/nickel transport system substrate-binding protein